jgi:hypothetical protein
MIRILALALLASPAFQQDSELVKDGKKLTFKSKSHNVTVSFDADFLNAEVDEEQLKDGDDDNQKILLVAQSPDEKTMAYLTWHKKVAKNTKVADYRDSTYKSIEENLGKAEKLGQTSISAECERLDFKVKTEDGEYRGVAIFLQVGDRYYNCVILTSDAWLTVRDKVEAMAKSVAKAK